MTKNSSDVMYKYAQIFPRLVEIENNQKKTKEMLNHLYLRLIHDFRKELEDVEDPVYCPSCKDFTMARCRVFFPGRVQTSRALKASNVPDWCPRRQSWSNP